MKILKQNVHYVLVDIVYMELYVWKAAQKDMRADWEFVLLTVLKDALKNFFIIQLVIVFAI